MQRIGVMGGSFNPIHCGHLNLARTALALSMVDRVLLLPSGNPPHKRAGLADKLDRLNMVSLAAMGEENMEVCREEVDREGVIYTVDTLRILGERMPGCRFYYLIGADTLRTLHTWRRPEEVIRLCTLLVAARPGEEAADLPRLMAHWRSLGADVQVLPCDLVDVSSTEIRERLAAGLPLAGLVPPAVEAYIRAHGLYQTSEEAASEEAASEEAAP